MINWRLHRLLSWVWIVLLVLDPSDVARGQREDLRSLALDIRQFSTIEGATLQVQAIEANTSVLVKLTVLKRGHQFQFVNSNLELSGRTLSKSVQERLWMQKIT